MHERLGRVLILDTDPGTLVKLQHVLENTGIDVTVTWDEAEAFQLLSTTTFDLILVEDHPPELDAPAIIEALSFRGTCPSVLILLPVIYEKAIEHFHRLGAVGVAAKQDPLAVLNRVTKALMSTQSAKAGRVEPRSLRAAS